LHQHLAVAFAQPIERETRDMGAAAPGGLEFGAKGAEMWPAWLGEEPATVPDLKAMLAPYPSDQMICWPVSSRVGKPGSFPCVSTN